MSNQPEGGIFVADLDGRLYRAELEGDKLRVGHLLFAPEELRIANLKITTVDAEVEDSLRKLGFVLASDFPQNDRD